MAELAVARGVPARMLFIDLLLEADGQVSMINFLMLDANVARGLQFPHVTIGSDNLGLCAGPEEAHAGKPHPRQHGCFAKVLGTYVRERGVLSWEGAVHKMTGQSAARLGLADRGVLRPGAMADVVMFDPRPSRTSRRTRRRTAIRPASAGCGSTAGRCWRRGASSPARRAESSRPPAKPSRRTTWPHPSPERANSAAVSE